MVRSIVITAVSLLAVSPAFAISISSAGDASSQSRLAMSQAGEEREPGPADLEEAIEIALERFGGQATRSETVVREGQTVHEVRVLADDGIVRTVRIDPETGAIIPQRR